MAASGSSPCTPPGTFLGSSLPSSWEAAVPVLRTSARTFANAGLDAPNVHPSQFRNCVPTPLQLKKCNQKCDHPAFPEGPVAGPENCFFFINAKKKRRTFRASRRIWNLEISRLLPELHGPTGAGGRPAVIIIIITTAFQWTAPFGPRVPGTMLRGGQSVKLSERRGSTRPSPTIYNIIGAKRGATQILADVRTRATMRLHIENPSKPKKPKILPTPARGQQNAFIQKTQARGQDLALECNLDTTQATLNTTQATLNTTQEMSNTTNVRTQMLGFERFYRSEGGLGFPGASQVGAA